MVIGPDFSRDARPEERDEIDALLRAAFGRPDEARLVSELRANGDLLTEIVKPWGDVIAGYAALSRMQSPQGWVCLAPLAVLPRLQRAAAAPDKSQRRHYSVGTRLATEIASLAQLSQHGHGKLPNTVVTLGNPKFFERAGFSLARAQHLSLANSTLPVLIARGGNDLPRELLTFPTALERMLALA